MATPTKTAGHNAQAKKTTIKRALLNAEQKWRDAAPSNKKQAWTRLQQIMFGADRRRA